MATSRRPTSSDRDDDVPKDFANVPATPPMLDHSFTLQAVMELQKTVSALLTKTDRLISDLSDQDQKLATVLSQISFVKGALYVLSGLLTLFILVAGWYFSGKLSIGIKS